MGIEYDETAALEDAGGSVTAGSVISGHRIERLLGSGGFGSVFAALDVDLGRAVAFKVLRSVDDKLLARFRDEARLLAKINDPHIIQIYRIGRLPSNEPFIAMELFGDGSLDAHFPIGRKAVVGEATEIVVQILQGLDVAHRAGVVHRDIKGANVLLDRNSGHVKLCDFGIARSQAGENEAQTGGMVLGTPHYIAPERMQGVKDDPRSDLYSVGVIFYRLLTGRRPYESPGASVLTILHRAMTEAPVLPEAIPRGIARACVRLLAPNPELRYPTAEAAIDALRAAVRTPATGGFVPDGAPRPARRDWAFWALGISGAVLAGAVGVRGLMAAAPEPVVDAGVAVVDARVVEPPEYDPVDEVLAARVPDATRPADLGGPDRGVPDAGPVAKSPPRPRPKPKSGSKARPKPKLKPAAVSKPAAVAVPTEPGRVAPSSPSSAPAARDWFNDDE
jgi:serine/threonine-protein kinase